MVYVSKKKVDPKIESVLADQLLSFFAAAKTKREAATLVGELFTESERVMFAKRLAVVVMLERGYSFQAIERALKVTPQTVSRLWQQRKDGAFIKICRYARARTTHFKKRGDRFLEALEEWLTLSGPRKGIRRRMTTLE